jgi:relaxase/mobilization nuclease domain protein
LKELGLLHEKKNTLIQAYSSAKSDMKELYQIRKNYEKYMGKEMGR